MRTIITGVALCLISIAGGIAIAVGVVIEALFRLARFIRYGYIKVMAEIIKSMKPRKQSVETWNNVVFALTVEDLKEEVKIHDLRM